LRTLAEITGLGISTVSQALRNSPAIAEETRKRVQLAAQQAGYRPNRAGVRLRTGKTNVITVVLNAQDEGAGFFSQFVYGVSDALANSGYHLVITPYDLHDPMAPIRYIVETGSADGIIISRTQPHDARVRYLTENNMPFVTHGRTDLGITHAFHDFDNESFAYEAVKQLAASGRRRIALVSPPPDLAYFNHTQNGFARAMQDFGLESFPLSHCSSDTPLDELYAIGTQVATMPNRPDGLVGTSTSAIFAFVAGMEKTGLLLGRDLDAVSKHAGTVMAIAMPKLISIHENFRMAGNRLACLLMRAIDGEPPELLQEVVGLDSQVT
jgi:LacI family transcriptional regulator